MISRGHIALAMTALGLFSSVDAGAHLVLDSPHASPASPFHLQALVVETWPALHDETAFPIEIAFVGSAPDSLMIASVYEAIEAAVATWNAVSCTSAKLSFVGHRERLDDTAAPIVPIFFSSTHPDEVPIAGTIGEMRWPGADRETYSIRLNDHTIRWDTRPHPFQRLVETDGEATIVDLQAVLTHELGHLLGLDHIRQNRAASMWGQYLRDGGQRELSAADKLSLCVMHPAREADARGPDECVRDQDCRPGARCIDHEIGSVCDKELGEVGAYCAWDLLYCPEVCHIDSPATGTGYCTQGCGSDDDCLEGYTCVSGEGEEPAARCLLKPIPAENGRSCSAAAPSHRPDSRPVSLLATVSLGLWMVTRRRRQRNSIPPTICS